MTSLSPPDMDTSMRAEIRILVRLTIALVVVGLVLLTAPILVSFSDLATIFFLAWLLAFLIRPLALRVSRLLSGLSYGVAVALAYAIVGIATAVVIAVVAVSLVQSLIDLTTSGTSLADQLAARLAPIQAQLDASGLGSIHLSDLINDALNTLDLGSSQTLTAFGSFALS